MAETIARAVLLDRIQAGYAQLEALLASVNEAQMTTPTSNGSWSIKDHIAHLTGWQGYLLDQLQGVLTDTKPAVFMPELSTVDEVNERFYHEHKDRPPSEVLAAFRTSYQRVLSTVEALSEEALNAPFTWRQDVASVGLLIAEDTYEHYREHGDTLQRNLTTAPH
jgi:uncharacterized protein (TIGR03083 family)